MLHPEHHQRAHAKGQGHGARAEKVLLDGVVQGEADGQGRQRGQKQQPDAARAGKVARRVGLEQAEEALAVEHHHGQDRAQLDGDLKGVGLGPGKVQDVSGQDEVPGAGHGQKFGQAFYKTHDHGDVPGGHRRGLLLGADFCWARYVKNDKKGCAPLAGSPGDLRSAASRDPRALCHGALFSLGARGGSIRHMLRAFSARPGYPPSASPLLYFGATGPCGLWAFAPGARPLPLAFSAAAPWPLPLTTLLRVFRPVPTASDLCRPSASASFQVVPLVWKGKHRRSVVKGVRAKFSARTAAVERLPVARCRRRAVGKPLSFHPASSTWCRQAAVAERSRRSLALLQPFITFPTLPRAAAVCPLPEIHAAPGASSPAAEDTTVVSSNVLVAATGMQGAAGRIATVRWCALVRAGVRGLNVRCRQDMRQPLRNP